VTVPDIDCPFPVAVSPHLGYARTRLAEWIGRTGLVRGAAELARFAGADFAWFAAAVHPGAGADRLALMAEWFAWLFLIDDQLDGRGLGTDLARAGRLRARLRDVLAGRAAVGPAALALADLWRRTRVEASGAWRSRFAAHLDRCLHLATTWEAYNRLHGIVPDERSYIPNRRHTGAIYVCMDLIEIVEEVEVPSRVYRAPEFADARDAACDVVCWTNDVYSLEKERALGEVHNLVRVLEWHRGWPTATACAYVSAAIGTETARYTGLERRLLHAYPAHGPVLRAVTAGMRSWISGNNEWSRRTHRYASREAPPPCPSTSRPSRDGAA
jgi:hypothetical protein